MAGSVKWEHQSAEERRAYGKQARKEVPRTTHGDWVAAPVRPDPVDLLHAQDAERQQDLVPIRWGRMSSSPFAFYRGAAALMAADLAPLPRTGLTVQLCGDAHLANFGTYGSPERTLLFDVNDFDETLPGPFEWDLKRLAASFVIAARHRGFDEATGRDAALGAARSYREHMATYAEMRELDVWYSRVGAQDALQALRDMARAASGAKATKALEKGAQKTVSKAQSRTGLQVATKLTEVVDGKLRIKDTPPLITHMEQLESAELVRRSFHDYAASLEDDRRELLERFKFLDAARKVVGVGSVGTYCMIALTVGRDEDDPLILQIKEAVSSVLEPYLGRSRFAHAGHRVVAGQRLMQAASDIFLGWMTGSAGQKRQFYWRQLRDMKGGVDLELVQPPALALYADLCGWALARGHARSGQRLAIAAYLGNSDRFDQSIADFAKTYADQTERDYETLLDAIKKGRIEVEEGV